MGRSEHQRDTWKQHNLIKDRLIQDFLYVILSEIVISVDAKIIAISLAFHLWLHPQYD